MSIPLEDGWSVMRACAHLAQELANTHERDRALQLITDTAARQLGVLRASIRLLDANEQALVAVVRSGTPVHLAPAPLQLGEGLLGWVAKHRAPLRLGDAPTDPRYLQLGEQRAALRSFLGVPLLQADRCLGVLSVVSPAQDVFSEHHEVILVLLAALSVPHLMRVS